MLTEVQPGEQDQYKMMAPREEAQLAREGLEAERLERGCERTDSQSFLSSCSTGGASDHDAQ
jgi:hypothetical protein